MDTITSTFEFDKKTGYSILFLKPALNSAPWSDIERTGDEVIRELETPPVPHLVVDLSELDYVGSSMVALLVRFWKIVKSRNARMVVVNRHQMVYEVLKIAGLDKVWDIFEYREDALYSLGVSPEAKTERRHSNLLAGLSIAATLAGAAALAVHWASPEALNLRILQGVAFGGAGLGLVLGLLLLVKAEGGRRALGISAAVVSLAVLVGAVFFLPLEGLALPRPDNADTPPAGVKTPQPAEAASKPAASLLAPAIAEKPIRPSAPNNLAQETPRTQNPSEEPMKPAEDN